MHDRAELLREVLEGLRVRLVGASDRDAAALAGQVRAVSAELVAAERAAGVGVVDDELEGRRALSRRPKSPGSRKRVAGGK